MTPFATLRHALLLMLVVCMETINAFIPNQLTTRLSSSTTAIFAEKSLTLYGSQGSRSPLVNWAAYELGLDITMGDLSRNPHPFGQIPCLEHYKIDSKDPTMVFESGAILLYLDALSDKSSNKGEIYSWVSWANASLDPICFLETPNGKVYDTGLKDVKNPKIYKLNQLLQERSFLVGDEISVADVAVASYLLYVVQFFPDVDLSTWPSMVQYMKRCASREEYGMAFGNRVQEFLLDKLDKMGSDRKEKLFRML
ncbi:glutathione S-transferase, C-terminal domain containing protein [Nitzschia inconspicua]|uniref:Glutathione S-transferase, C-terminal domain containing protein n=1 Tax=Nitzschia inconspicua TaxID=303405 RepID=A0A9K3L316_9STRA|nr:glutathione S-transferase, C-terminal domain containing protein [Nitzschia inconspicua]